MKEALKLAYDYIDNVDYGPYDSKPVLAAIKAALAQPEGCQCPECQIKPHTSDCAVHNEPAYPKGRCDCGAQPEQKPVAWAMLHDNGHYIDAIHPDEHARVAGKYIHPLYTTPKEKNT